MVVRLGGDLTIDEQSAAAERVVSLVRATRFDGVHAVATGSPLLVKEINDRMRGDMAFLGAAAALAMAVVLLLIFRVRWRLLSLGVMVLGVIWGFGVIGYLGIPLTMVTISGLPILIGLGVDFAVQIHSRYEGELARDPESGISGALRRTFLRLGPAVSVAAVAAVVGFLALRTSDVPMVRDYGLLLSIGTAAAFVAALVPLPAVLVWRDRHRHWTAPGVGHRRVERATHALSTVGRGHAIIVLVVALLIAIAGTRRDGTHVARIGPRALGPPGQHGPARPPGTPDRRRLVRRARAHGRDARRAPARRAALDVRLRGARRTTLRRPTRQLDQCRLDHVAGHLRRPDAERCTGRARGRARSHPALVHQQ